MWYRVYSALPLLPLLLHPIGAGAVGLGDLRLRSALGEPLRAEISLSVAAGESVDRTCLRVGLQAGEDDGLPWVPAPHFDLQRQAGGYRLLVTTAAPLLEPAARLGVRVDCGSAQILRLYTVVPDLPPAAPKLPPAGRDESLWTLAPGETPESLAEALYPDNPAMRRRFLAQLRRLNPPEAEAEEARTLRLPPPAPARRRPSPRPAEAEAGAGGLPAASRDRVALSTPETAAESLAQHRAPARAEGGTARPAAPAPEPGLRLSTELSPLRLSTELSSTPEAPESMRQILRLEYRMLALVYESQADPAGPSLGRMRSLAAEAGAAPAAETLAVAPAATEPQQKTESAPAHDPAPAVAPQPPATPAADRPAEPARRRTVAESSSVWPWGLTGGIGALLGLGGFAWWWRRRASGPVRGQAPATVLAAGERAAARAQAAAVDIELDDGPPTVVTEHPAGLPPRPAAAPTISDFASGELPASVDTLAADAPAAPVPPPPPPEDSVNPVLELAEIMLSFGRIEGAAQTLNEFISINPTEALQPWLKLLDIYRESGRQTEFEDLARRLNRNFNVEIQPWSAAAGGLSMLPSQADGGGVKAQTLEDMPHIRDQLVEAWGTPAAIPYLMRLLRDNRDGTRSGFPLAVAQEILFLIDMAQARDAEPVSQP